MEMLYYETLYQIDYDDWKDQGCPTCDECDAPVLVGRKHFCKLLQKEVVIPEPKRWPL